MNTLPMRQNNFAPLPGLAMWLLDSLQNGFTFESMLNTGGEWPDNSNPLFWVVLQGNTHGYFKES